ncbi:MAG: hypothetical protein EBR82_65930, partial [Caulobacteraceae bacterium]|nr:hypothetical protein [Caulobacteraceae bacterium]
QAGQEQLAENIALQRQGFDVPTMRGVAGQAALEGLAGFGLGAGLGAMPGPRAPTSELDELRKKLAEAAQTSTETATSETETEPEKKKKEKRLKLEDLNPAGVEELRAELAKHTTDEGYRKERNAKKFLENGLKLAGISGDQLKEFKKLDIDELINAATKFITPKEEQGEQLDQLDQPAGGEGAGVSGKPGAGTTAAGTTAPGTSGVGGAPDASQQAGVGAKPPDTTLTTPPATPPATPPPKQEAIVQQAQEEFNKFDTALRQQQTKLDSLKGQESTPEYKQTFDSIRYLATQRSNAGAQLSQAETVKGKPKNYWRPNPSAPKDSNSWQDKTGFIHYKIDKLLPNNKSRVTELIDQEQAQNIALLFTDSKGNSNRVLSVSLDQKGIPYWLLGDASEEVIRKNIGDDLYNSIGKTPVTDTNEYQALVQRIKTALETQPVSTSTTPTKSLAEKAAAAKAAFEARKKAAKGNLSISAFEEARIIIFQLVPLKRLALAKLKVI